LKLNLLPQEGGDMELVVGYLIAGVGLAILIACIVLIIAVRKQSNNRRW